MASLKITGLSDLRRDLRRLAEELAPKVAPALTAALRPMADRARDLAPVLTGRTRSAIAVVEHAPHGGVCSSAVELPLEYGVHRDLGTHGQPGAHELEQAAEQTEAPVLAHVIAQITKELGR